MALNTPHGGTLIDLLPATEDEKKNPLTCPEWNLSERQVCDLEMLMNGAFSPLTGFLNQAEYDAVLETMRLPAGQLWPMPVTLDVDDETAARVHPGDTLVLRDAEGVALALLDVESRWQPDKAREAQAVFGTRDEAHPAVNYLNNHARYRVTHPL